MVTAELVVTVTVTAQMTVMARTVTVMFLVKMLTVAVVTGIARACSMPAIIGRVATAGVTADERRESSIAGV